MSIASVQRRQSVNAVNGIFVAGALIGFAGPAVAANWYVDGLHGSITWPPVPCVAGGPVGGTTPTCAFQQLWQALNKVTPGDTVYIVNPTVAAGAPPYVYPKLGFTKSGTAAAPLTLAGYDPTNTGKLTYVSGGGIATGIWINGNYVVVSNFNVTAPGYYPGISFGANMHHITVTGNVIHDAGGNGINVYNNDYMTISRNVVYGNAKNTTKAFNSGISLKYSVNVDNSTAVKMIVDSNIVYSNTNIPNCSTPQCLVTARDTDGNGIILDTNTLQTPPYLGAFLVQNNVVYRNGGRGIYVYKSDHATITGNTAYDNNQDPYLGYWHPGEIGVDKGGSVGIYNNIVYSDGLNGPDGVPTSPNTHVSLSFENCTNGGPIIAQYNLGYDPQNIKTWFSYVKNNTSPVTIAANLWGGPKFEGPSAGNFVFQPTSPAYKTGNAATSAAVDILGASRLPLPSIGAYQNPGP